MKVEYYNVKVRKAVLNDAAALADIFCCAWNSAFSDILTADELAKNVNLPK